MSNDENKRTAVNRVFSKAGAGKSQMGTADMARIWIVGRERRCPSLAQPRRSRSGDSALLAGWRFGPRLAAETRKHKRTPAGFPESFRPYRLKGIRS